MLGNPYLSWLRHRKSTLEFHIPESEKSSKDLKFWPPPTCTNFTAARLKSSISILFVSEKHRLMVHWGKNDLRLKMFCSVEKGFCVWFHSVTLLLITSCNGLVTEDTHLYLQTLQQVDINIYAKCCSHIRENFLKTDNEEYTSSNDVSSKVDNDEIFVLLKFWNKLEKVIPRIKFNLIYQLNQLKFAFKLIQLVTIFSVFPLEVRLPTLCITAKLECKA